MISPTGSRQLYLTGCCTAECPSCAALNLQEKTPDYDSYCLLAEAFLAIQEPDKAARAYEVCRAPS
jgi:hypothetical protein